ncbi:hypothetical protein ACHAPT_008135 [Fusarium lateritium]
MVNSTGIPVNCAACLDGETQPLLSRPLVTKSGIRRRMVANVSRDWADIVLLSCYVITGMLDGVSISTWGAFVSMQTGNTVYVGLGPTAGTDRWKKSGTSILSFCAGSFFFSRLHRRFSPSPKSRYILCTSFIIQAASIMAAASIIKWGPQGGAEGAPWHVLTPIAIVAFQSCGQAITSRALQHNALTSVVLTSIYCDLFTDAQLFQSILANAERNRRVAAPTLLLTGALLGGLLANSSVGAAGALWVAAGLKLVVALAWGFWPAE